MTAQTDPPDAPSAAPVSSRRRWLKIALAASMCANLLLAGLVGGALLRFGMPHEGARGDGDAFTLMRLARHLPDAQRGEMRALLRDHRPRFEALRPARGQARRAIADVLEAEVFDGAGLATAQRRAREVQSEGRAVVDAAFAAFVARLTPEARKALAGEIRDTHGRRHDAHRKDSARELDRD
jgi:uncharacterized membrane protein